MALRVLIVQTEVQTARALSRLVKDKDNEVWEAWQLGQALALVKQVRPDVIFLDLHFPGDEWQTFIKQSKQLYPEVRLIITNKHPDLKREMLAKQLGVNIFLRHPFTRRWVMKAIERLQEDEEAESQVSAAEEPGTMPRVRIPVRIKITLPYLVLAVLFALATAYIVSQMVFDTVQDRYLNQLLATGKQSADWMVQEEDRLLSTLRSAANTEGVGEALAAGDSEALRNLILPIAVNNDEEVIELLNREMISQLSLRLPAGAAAGAYQVERGETFFKDEGFVRLVAAGVVDDLGDKYPGVVEAPWGAYFYVAGPVFDAENNPVGMVLVGKSLTRLAAEMQADTLASVSFYDFDGNGLQSTLFRPNDTVFAVPNERVLQILGGQEHSSIIRDIQVNSVDYSELLGTWEARSGLVDIGLIGISLPQAFLIRTSQVTRLQVFGLSLAGVLLVVLIGVWLANLITRPLLRLVGASTQVAQGNLDIKVNSSGNDEVAILAHSFNSMVAGLQEGSIYRDLLGRTVSPEVREQLRQTFSSGNLRLEGQEAVATVLMADIRDFTTMAEKSDPSTIFEWLNEYFGELLPIIVEHGGVVNKMDGDAVLAFFGILPRMISPKKSALAGCQAAMEMANAIDALNRKRKRRGDPPFLTGIGVHTGVVMAGGLGTSDRMHYTIIGDTVNTTQRLEHLTRQIFVESGILISQATYSALGVAADTLNLESVGLHTVKGKEERIMVYRLNTSATVPKLDVML
jgi:class 3 adenylate cyclase/CheY-like chemotaxis protein